ncbi:uncharacterized [Tachysurus ichikawai]
MNPTARALPPRLHTSVVVNLAHVESQLGESPSSSLSTSQEAATLERIGGRLFIFRYRPVRHGSSSPVLNGDGDRTSFSLPRVHRKTNE